MAEMSPRQAQIKARLNRGMSARAIAEELGVTRNAVYQQIQRLRRDGNIEPGYTPTGVPPRESAPGASMLAQLLDDGSDISTAGTIALLQELRYTRDQLSALVYRLSHLLPQ